MCRRAAGPIGLFYRSNFAGCEGACIIQKGQPVAYYSKKLNGAQKNYSTIDKELLLIVMTLKEFWSMLLGAVINIPTDHKNILGIGDSLQRCLRWISYVDEYDPMLHYIKGPTNVITDTFTRMPMLASMPLAMVGKEDTSRKCETTCHPNSEPTTASEQDADPLDCHFSLTEDREMSECFQHLPAKECYLNLPEDSTVDNPLNIEAIKEQQDADQELQRTATKYADQYTHKSISEIDNVLCLVKPGDPPANWRIALPKLMLQPIIRWFHQITGHPGSKRLYIQISAHYYHRDLQRMIDNYHCNHCQHNKLDGKGYGHLHEHEIRSMPFDECAVDLIGPWTIQVWDKPYEFNALTMIDTVSNLVELVRIDDKTPGHIAKKYAQV
jgi:hypothetical protein